jgi:predicted RecB family nuclease
MKKTDNKITLSPTDLSNHLGCKHLTELNREVALGIRAKPSFANPSLAALAERGLAHEKAYVNHLMLQNRTVIELPEDSTTQNTIQLMKKGVDIIAQPTLSDENWNGRADLLIKVNRPSPNLGMWSYEVGDTKLAVETKAGTILQLSVYSDIVSQIQGLTPEFMHVIKPGNPFEEEKFRYDDYKAYYGHIKRKLIDVIAAGPQETYPEPVEQCNICRWWQECDRRRRMDDHLSLIASIRKIHIGELNKNNVNKLEQFAKLDKPLPGKPERGHLDSYIKVHEQAKIQLKGKGLEKPIYDLLPFQEKKGFNRLPDLSDGDVYFDFEGDPFISGGGLEYLFGFVFKENNEFRYKSFWALNRNEEKKAFDEFITFIMERWANFPDMHIYHYSPYEPSAIKRLMSRYAIHEINVDKILRGQRFIDLYSTSKETLRASVETYSIKYLEKLADYKRKCDLQIAGTARRTLEYILEFKSDEALDAQTKLVVQEYNEDDCRATLALHHWLEMLRNEQLAKGAIFVRPDLIDGNPKEEQTDHEKRLKTLYEELVADIDGEPKSDEEKARWLLAHLVHYFDREKKNEWWEFFRVHKMESEELYEEKSAIAGLTFLNEVPKTGRQKKSRYKYSFPIQEINIDVGSELHEVNGDKLGDLEEIQIDEQTLISSQDPGRTPNLVHAINKFNSRILEDALITVIQDFKANGVVNNTKYKAARDLLLRKAPNNSRIKEGEILIKNVAKLIEELIALASSMQESILAIQGPPGTGKTFTGAKIVLELVKAGKKVGVTAVSHKVIRNFLNKVYEFAKEENVENKISFFHKTSSSQNCPNWLNEIEDNTKAIECIQSGKILGATTFLWANNLAVDKLEYLVVDEAGQMSLANVIAASRASKNLILLGDPQQLEQPQKGAHPEGADVAALTHFLGDKQTIPPEKGIFLGVTYRLHPLITNFTSELFYENRLIPKDDLKKLSIEGDANFSGAGLFYVPVNHSGRQTSSEEEVKEVKMIVETILKNKVQWINRKGERNLLTENDILIVAPYNSQVKALSKALPGLRIGTVDKFQGQEAPIVIYSITCSSSEDAPRGMNFLYSPNRLNVATSRALCMCILVGTKQIFEAECRTIEQMKWVNAFCRFRELAVTIEI